MTIFEFSPKPCCDHSSEPSRRDGSDEGLQHIFYVEITKKKIHNYNQIPLLIFRALSAMPMQYDQNLSRKLRSYN